MVTLASSQTNTANAEVLKSTEAQIQSKSPLSVSSPYIPVNGFPKENQLRDLQFQLTHNLQSSLDLSTTLELFYNNIQEVVSLHGMDYQLPDSERNITFGVTRAHKARYNIRTDNSQMGRITFSRAKRFLETELAVLEMLVGVLLFPLRNALLYQQAVENSLRDTLTGIGNRNALDASFEREVKIAKRHKQNLSLLVLDIDHFKQVNDQFGHQQGDLVLKQLAKTLQNSLREIDQIFRFGGEEFVVILNNTLLQDAYLTAERIRVNMAMTPCQLNGNDVFTSVSIGVSQLKRSDDRNSLFDRADSALYAAKASGRNKVYTELNLTEQEISQQNSKSMQREASD